MEQARVIERLSWLARLMDVVGVNIHKMRLVENVIAARRGNSPTSPGTNFSNITLERGFRPSDYKKLIVIVRVPAEAAQK
jgi:hypothetical protein